MPLRRTAVKQIESLVVRLTQIVVMKKFFKISGIILGSVIAIGIITFLILNEQLPTGESGTKAEQLANKMLQAINHEAYKNTRYLEWSMLDMHF